MSRATRWISGTLLFALAVIRAHGTSIGEAWGRVDPPAASRPVTSTAAPPTARERIAAWEGHVNRLEQLLFDDARDGRFDYHDLAAAALVAGGVDSPEELRRRTAAVASLVDELLAELGRGGEATMPGAGAARATSKPSKLAAQEAAGVGPEGARDRAAAVLEFLHRHVLVGGYDITASDPRMALDRGMYNCVTATVLFNCLAGAAGLEVCALEMPGHAMSRVLSPDGPIDVETTCREWFRLSGDPKRRTARVEATLGAAAPDRSLARPIGQVELVSMIYYNRGVDLLAERRFAEAAAANAKALRLNPASPTARGNLLATLNNWSIALGVSGRYDEAAELLRRGLEIDADYKTFLLNAAHVYHQWALSLCRQERFDEALAAIESGRSAFPMVAYLRAAPIEVYRAWARQRFDEGDEAAAIEVLDAARAALAERGDWPAAEAEELAGWAARLADEGQLARSLWLLDFALKRQPGCAALVEARRAVARRAEADGGASPPRFAASSDWILPGETGILDVPDGATKSVAPSLAPQAGSTTTSSAATTAGPASDASRPMSSPGPSGSNAPAGRQPWGAGFGWEHSPRP